MIPRRRERKAERGVGHGFCSRDILFGILPLGTPESAKLILLNVNPWLAPVAYGGCRVEFLRFPTARTFTGL